MNPQLMLEVTGLPGATILEVCVQAHNLARKFLIAVAFSFNGYKVVMFPHMDPVATANEYMEKK